MSFSLSHWTFSEILSLLPSSSNLAPNFETIASEVVILLRSKPLKYSDRADLPEVSLAFSLSPTVWPNSCSLVLALSIPLWIESIAEENCWPTTEFFRASLTRPNLEESPFSALAAPVTFPPKSSHMMKSWILSTTHLMALPSRSIGGRSSFSSFPPRSNLANHWSNQKIALPITFVIWNTPELIPVNAGNRALTICEATVKTTCATSPRIVAKMWNIENRPVNVHSSLSAKLFVMISFEVKFSKAFVIRTRPSALAFMNTRRKAVPIWPRTLTTAQKMFANP